MSAGVLRLTHESEVDLTAKLAHILRRRGYCVTPAQPERLSVGQLARLVGRPVSTVCMSLRRPSCPPFVSAKGKRRFIWIEVNERLLSFLRDWRKGQRI